MKIEVVLILLAASLLMSCGENVPVQSATLADFVSSADRIVARNQSSSLIYARRGDGFWVYEEGSVRKLPELTGNETYVMQSGEFLIVCEKMGPRQALVFRGGERVAKRALEGVTLVGTVAFLGDALYVLDMMEDSVRLVKVDDKGQTNGESLEARDITGISDRSIAFSMVEEERLIFFVPSLLEVLIFDTTPASIERARVDLPSEHIDVDSDALRVLVEARREPGRADTVAEIEGASVGVTPVAFFEKGDDWVIGYHHVAIIGAREKLRPHDTNPYLTRSHMVLMAVGTGDKMLSAEPMIVENHYVTGLLDAEGRIVGIESVEDEEGRGRWETRILEVDW